MYSATCDQIDKTASDLLSSIQSSGESAYHLADIKQQLGQPNKVSILGADQFYAWETFMAFDAADGSGTGSGYYPGYNAKNGTNAAIKALGKPSIHITDNLTQYEWQCTGTSSLLLAAYDNQQIKKASGDYCTQGKCMPYAIDFTATSKAANAYDQVDKF